MKNGLIISNNEEFSSVLVEFFKTNDIQIDNVSGPYYKSLNHEHYHFIILDYCNTIVMNEFLYKQKRNSKLIVLHSSNDLKSFKGNFKYHLVDKNINAISNIEKVVSSLVRTIDRDEYIPLNIGFFLKYNFLGVSAYLKMSDQKYIRVLDSEIEQDQKFLNELKKKEVPSLFIKNKDLDDFFQNVLEKIYENNNETIDAYKINQDCVEYTQNRLHSIGINKNDLNFVKEVFDNSFRNIEKLDLFLELKKMMSSRLFTYQLATMVAHISLVIAKRHFINVFFEKDDLLWAALFQDISLEENDFCQVTSKQQLDELDLTENLYTYINEHPKRSAELLSKSEGEFSIEVIKMIQTHHERPDGHGFPGLAELSALSIPQKIQIISNTFCYKVLNSKEDELDIDLILNDLREQFDIKGYDKIISSLEAAFNKS